MPSGVCRLGNTLRCIFMNRMLAIIASSAAIAAYSVHRQADSFFNPVTIGMADTVALLAGILVGEEDRPMMKRLLEMRDAGQLNEKQMLYFKAPRPLEEFYDLANEDEDSLSFQPLAHIDSENERNWAMEWILQILAQEGMEFYIRHTPLAPMFLIKKP